jgi:hypothetical protein
MNSINNLTSQWIVPLLRCILSFVLLYSSFSKFVDFELFLNKLGKSPLLPASVIAPVGVSVILTEFILPVLLFFRRTEAASYLLICIMMYTFTGYIIIVWQFSPYVPCSCGGVTEKLSWPQHIILNVLVFAIAFFCYRTESKKTN